MIISLEWQLDGCRRNTALWTRDTTKVVPPIVSVTRHLIRLFPISTMSTIIHTTLVRQERIGAQNYLAEIAGTYGKYS